MATGDASFENLSHQFSRGCRCTSPIFEVLASFLGFRYKSLACRLSQPPVQNRNQFFLLIARKLICGFQDISER
jgi:hypothetical protein